MNNILRILVLLLASCFSNRENKKDNNYTTHEKPKFEVENTNINDKQIIKPSIEIDSEIDSYTSYDDKNHLKSKKCVDFHDYELEISIQNELSKYYIEERILLDILASPLSVCIGTENNNIINTYKYQQNQDIQEILNYIEEIGRIREEAFNSIHDYLLLSSAHSYWFKPEEIISKLQSEISISELSEENLNDLKYIISDNRYNKVINYHFEHIKSYHKTRSYNNIKDKDKDTQKIIEYTKELDSPGYFQLNYELEEIQKRADKSGKSGIVYELRLDEEGKYLYPKIIFCKSDRDRKNIKE